MHRIEDRTLKVPNGVGLSSMCFFVIAAELPRVAGLVLGSRGGGRGRGISIILIDCILIFEDNSKPPEPRGLIHNILAMSAQGCR